MRASQKRVRASPAGGGPVVRCRARDLPLHQSVRRRGLARGKPDLAAGGEIDLLAGAAAGRDLEGCWVAGEGGVEFGQGVLHRGLDAVPDDVDLGVVGDGLERDVRHALVDEAVADIVMGGVGRGGGALDLGGLLLAVFAIGEEIPGIFRAHDPRAGERERHAAGVDGDPAPAPLLGDEGGGARAAGWVEDQIAGVGGHEEATFNDLRRTLNDICFVFREPVIRTSRHKLEIGETAKSLRNLRYISVLPIGCSR